MFRSISPLCLASLLRNIGVLQTELTLVIRISVNSEVIYGMSCLYTTEFSIEMFSHFGYGLVSLFRRDFDDIGGFNLSIQGWGLEVKNWFIQSNEYILISGRRHV